MLSGMLLHVVPATLKVDLLTYDGSRWQGLRGVTDTTESLALNERDRDRVG